MKKAEEFRDIYRVRNALKKLETYNDSDLNRYIKPILESRLGKEQKVQESNKTLIAFSGGIDSKATLLITKKFKLHPEAVTFVLSPSNRKPIESFCQKNNVKIHFISDNYRRTILEEAKKKRFHPCGRCHRFMTEKIYEFAEKREYKFIAFGDMLSVGSHSIIKMGEMYRLNIPAMLSLTKEDHIEMVGEEFDGFGCEFLKNLHKKYPHLKRYSIQRVLRELRCQSISPETAGKLIKDIEGDNSCF